MREAAMFNKSTEKSNGVEELSAQPKVVYSSKEEGMKMKAKKDISHYRKHSSSDDLYKKNLAIKLRNYTHYVF
ncbi:hypothetical protein R9C00_06785 [Flammeovirgaceae bacterium SG7u.111]|nr:hypothetical protein [Flammeovirgaceae bacterium SG7u.132]WPO37148.1 hypothetical protein R9C00_06785 [Flammeovirgaceae bacterium SG7u.111]